MKNYFAHRFDQKITFELQSEANDCTIGTIVTTVALLNFTILVSSIVALHIVARGSPLTQKQADQKQPY